MPDSITWHAIRKPLIKRLHPTCCFIWLMVYATLRHTWFNAKNILQCNFCRRCRNVMQKNPLLTHFFLVHFKELITHPAYHHSEVQWRKNSFLMLFSDDWRYFTKLSSRKGFERIMLSLYQRTALVYAIYNISRKKT